MDDQSGYVVWLPFVVTATVWMSLVFAIAAIASKTWADLFGLTYLLATPFIYRGLKSLVHEHPHRSEGRRSGPPVPETRS